MIRMHGAPLLANQEKSDLLARRRYLIDRVSSPDFRPSAMPGILPSQFKGEWFVGTASMTSAALANLAIRFPETRDESRAVVKLLIDRMLSEDGRDFDLQRWGIDPLADLDGTNGHVGWYGHLGFMLGAYEVLGGDDLETEFRQTIETMSRKIERRSGMCLETYPGETYLPDNLVAIAAIAIYERSHGPVKTPIADRWIAHARATMIDDVTGLLPFYLDGRCTSYGEPRGSGAGWASFYLPFIDRDFAKEQYSAFKDHFLQRRVFTGFREWRHGTWSLIGDVDSGPVIFGLSPSGTGFGIAGAVLNNDEEVLDELLLTAEVVGSTVEISGRRRYLMAPLVGDAIMLAMLTAIEWPSKPVSRAENAENTVSPRH